MGHVTLEPQAPAASAMQYQVRAPVEAATRAAFSVPSEQLYYWSREWQVAESEAVQELERGEGVAFDNPADAVRWLLDGDDSED